MATTVAHKKSLSVKAKCGKAVLMCPAERAAHCSTRQSSLPQDPVLECYLHDFNAIIVRLENAKMRDCSDFLASQLCALSRDIRFRLGPPRMVSDAIVIRVQRSFTRAVKVLSRKLAKSRTAMVCQRNIESRAASMGSAPRKPR
jgi:hypothetical protein